MVYKIHFNGQVFGPVSDADAASIREGVIQAAQTQSVANFGCELNGTRMEGIWTTGAPISFEYIAED